MRKREALVTLQQTAGLPAMEAHAGARAKPVATGSSLPEFEVVQSVTDPNASSAAKGAWL
jgi:hypothetical protein